VVAQECLPFEPQRGEHRYRRLLLGHDLDHELGKAHPDCLQQRPAGEGAADPHTTMVGMDHESELSDVVRPSRHRKDGDDPDHLPVVVERHPASAAVVHPGGDDVGVDVLLDERHVPRGQLGEELLQSRDVLGRKRNDRHLSSPPTAIE